MYTRLLTFRGATDIDGGVSYLLQEAVPTLNAQRGYKGVTASADRARGVFGILSLWETEADRSASNSALGKARDEALEIVGGDLTIENLEQVAVEMAKPVKPGCALFVTRVSMDPVTVDENIAFFKSDVLPQIASQPGFCGLRNMLDRAAGTAVVGSVWETREALDAFAVQQPERRKIAETRGVRFGETESREILFAEIK
jgi:heme-degrading monooxygenase HmoA